MSGARAAGGAAAEAPSSDGGPVPVPGAAPTDVDMSGMYDPAGSGGLREMLRRRYLLRLLLRRELKARYKGSLLGLGWSYVRPAVYFCVYFFVIGVFMGMDRVIEDFPVYLFSAMVLVNLFTETLTSATRSVLHNAPLVRKVFLPRELFPTASLLVSLVHFLPGLAILVIAAIASGARPSPSTLAGALVGFAIVVLLGMGLGLLCSAITVFFHDMEQVVDISMIVVVWSVPMIYPWTHVRDSAPDWVLDLYLANPLVSAVTLFQRAFWLPGTRGDMPPVPHLTAHTLASLAFAVAMLLFGQWIFARLQSRFAQEL
ncbi:transport permease protein [Actinomadura rubrobrunea]|uniref:Transport permease protein n=1 Tax=Actinomadura rubrobrunea TaxID=115335 RepID=A0A9W6PVK9_9ACTN|nr:ABC transporter permease [Actinomadura rubrobrunea]GLW65294.1 transport permease protein [Actinomadura rubrobrunea]